MHLLVPFASDDSEACRHVLRDLALPNLTRLLARLEPAGRDEGPADSFSPPHERALAAARGWPPGDGILPFAAEAARRDGVAVGDLPWGLVTPAHWLLGRDHATMLDPAALGLGEAESRELFDAVRGLFESDGFAAAWGAPCRWYVGHAGLEGFPTASLDRVIGRNVDRWLGETRSPIGRRIRRLQSEAQLVLHAHPVNEAREARGEPVVNSFWLSGCGRARPAVDAAAEPTAVDAAAEPSIDWALRAPLLSGDWAAWAEAWHRLDADAIARAGGDATATLTLCGERNAARFETRPRNLVQRLHRRWHAAEAHVLLETL